jgi:Uma2 family endonuclease
MQGASMNHNKIVANLLGGIVPYLKGNRCQVFPGDMRVYIPTAGSFTYPDISILCDEPDVLDDTYLDTIRNPTVIIEVLSPSTENYDRGKKFFIYRQIPALKEYILISTTSCSIRASHKQADGSWKFNDLNGKESILSIPTIQYQCPLAEVYDRVLF